MTMPLELEHNGAGGAGNGATAAQAIVDVVGATGTAKYDWSAMLADPALPITSLYVGTLAGFT